MLEWSPNNISLHANKPEHWLTVYNDELGWYYVFIFGIFWVYKSFFNSFYISASESTMLYWNIHTCRHLNPDFPPYEVPENLVTLSYFYYHSRHILDMSCDLEGILIHTRITQTVRSLIQIRHRYFFFYCFSLPSTCYWWISLIYYVGPNEILCMSALPSVLKNTFPTNQKFNLISWECV